MDSEENQKQKRIKLELDSADRPLNFSISPEEYEMPAVKKPKIPRDPMSHRIIEKRRRDRMNNCLADLSRLIPSNYLNQGQGRIEKTEIIEMATRHITHLQNLFKIYDDENGPLGEGKSLCCKGKFYLGFKDCQDEVIRFFVEEEGWDTKDPLCVKIMNHLEQASQKLIRSTTGNKQCSLKSDVMLGDEGSNQSFASGMQPNHALPPDCECCPMSNVQCKKANNVVSSDDQHLRKLLTLKDQETTQEQDQPCLSLMTIGSLERSGMYSNKNFTESEKSSENIDSDMSSGTSSGFCSNSRDNVYKFKHNITRRFSQERYHQQTSDTSSSSSREDDTEKVKRKFVRHKSESPSSDSTNYPASDCSSGGNQNDVSTSSSKSKRKISTINHQSGEASGEIPLPAFVLHPNGTHYVPLSIHQSMFENVFKENDAGNGSLFHPISIPVNFSGPCVSKISKTSKNLLPSDGSVPNSAPQQV